MKSIIKCLVLLLVLSLVGCGNGGAKKVKVDPKEFMTLSYKGELEGKATPVINVDEDKLNELVGSNIDYLMKKEYKDQHDSFKAMGYSFKYSDAFMYFYDGTQLLKNGDEVKVSFEPYGAFSEYEMSDILSKANISMPESVSFKVEGLLPVSTVDFTKGKDLNKFMVFTGADGQGNITFDINYGFGDYQVQDSSGRTYYLKEHKAAYEGEETYYDVVVDNTSVGQLQLGLVVEEFKGVKEDHPMYLFGDSRRYEFEEHFSNGDKVHVVLYGPGVEGQLEKMGVIMENTISSHTISEFGVLVDDNTLNNIDINQVLEKFEDYARETYVLSDEDNFSDFFDNFEVYKATLKPDVDRGSFNGTSCLILYFRYHNEYEEYDDYTYFYNIHSAADGSVDGEWGEVGVATNDYDYLFGSTEKSERLEILRKFFDLEKIY